MYQFLGRDTLALRCSAQESLFIRKVSGNGIFCGVKSTLLTPLVLPRIIFVIISITASCSFAMAGHLHIKNNMQQSTSISAAQFASKALAYSITLFFPDYPFFFQIPDSALPVSLFRKWIRKKMLPAFLDFLSQKRIK